LETSEAAADDDYSMWLLRCGHGWHSAAEHELAPAARKFVLLLCVPRKWRL
jgi:hypothetical protein